MPTERIVSAQAGRPSWHLDGRPCAVTRVSGGLGSELQLRLAVLRIRASRFQWALCRKGCNSASPNPSCRARQRSSTPPLFVLHPNLPNLDRMVRSTLGVRRGRTTTNHSGRSPAPVQWKRKRRPSPKKHVASTTIPVRHPSAPLCDLDGPTAGSCSSLGPPDITRSASPAGHAMYCLAIERAIMSRTTEDHSNTPLLGGAKPGHVFLPWQKVCIRWL